MFPDHDVVRHVLPNGLTVLVRPDRSAPVAAVVTWVRAGYFDETDDVSGIAHVLEHMYFKGTPTRGVGEIAKQTKASGGYLNASTIYDHTRYYAVLPSSGFAAGLAIQADAYANSLIDADELRRELEVIIEEARRKSDTPEAVTTETLFELMHDRHRIRRWRIGREAELRALRQEHLHRFYRNFYVPQNTILGVVGDVDADVTLRLVEQHYGSLGGAAPTRVPGENEVGATGRRYRELSGGIAHAHAAIGWRTPGATHPDTPLLDLASAVLSSGRASRLYRAVREAGLATGASSWNYTPRELGVFVTQWSGAPDKLEGAARAVWREIATLPETLSATELARAQRLSAARTLRRLESMDGQANYLVDWESLGSVAMGNEYAERLQSATVDEVRDAVRRHLDAGQASVLVYQPDGVAPFASSTDEAFARITAGSASGVAAIPPLVEVAAPQADAVRKEGVVEGVHVFRTSAGIPILVKPRLGAPIVHLAAFANGGSSREPDGREGISTLMVRATVKGTTTRSAEAIALESELLGGGISPSASSDGLGWGFSVPTESFAQAAALLGDVVCNPVFGQEALETERTAAQLQLVQLQDDMYRYPSRLASAAAFAGHPYARSTLGTDEGLKAATVDSVREWHAEQVLRGDVVLGVVGDVDPELAAAQMAGVFSVLRHRPVAPLEVPAWTHGGAQVVEERPKAQTAMVLAWPGPSRTDSARHAAHLLSVIVSGLGGRFFEELRDKQSLAYTVHASLTARVAAGLYAAYIATSPEKEAQAREGLLREFARLRDEPVTDEELERARTYALGTQAIAQQSAGHVLNEIIDAWVHGSGLAELGTLESALRAVTAADIQQLAQRYFSEGSRVEGIVRGVAGKGSGR